MLCVLWARDSEPLFTHGLTRRLNERKLEEGYKARGNGEHKERGPLMQEAESRQMQGAGIVDSA